MAAETFGKRVKRARRRIGYSQLRTAKVLGCTEKTIWNWENDLRTRPDLALVVQFAALTGSSVTWLYEGVNDDDDAAQNRRDPGRYERLDEPRRHLPGADH